VTSAPAGWDDAAVRSPGGHVLQSSAWAEIREGQGWHAEFHRIGEPLPVALVLWRALPGGMCIGYVPRGPIVRDGSQLPKALDALARLARERQAIFVKIDPELDPAVAEEPMRQAGLRRAADIQPVLATLELDLAPEEDVLMAALDKDTRWSIRQASRRAAMPTFARCTTCTRRPAAARASSRAPGTTTEGCGAHSPRRATRA